MSDKRYEANIIRTTAVEPANNLETTSAPGVWSIDEVVELQKKNKWPTAGNVTTDVTDVFSTFLYDGNATAKSITNGIDLSGEGGLVWTKERDDVRDHQLYDTARGADKALESSDTIAEHIGGAGVVAFNSNGFNLGTGSRANANNAEFVSWTFRKAPKFFDVVKYDSSSGNVTNFGSAGATVNHNLGSVPGMIIVKCTDTASTNWKVYHRGLNGGTNPEQYEIELNQTGAEANSANSWNDTAPTSTQFTLGASGDVNNGSRSYVAYLFAHNNNDGGFGPDQDQDIIKCGNYTGNGSSTGPSINLGFEPQFLMLKNASTAYNWIVVDVMRGFSAGPQANTLFWNTSAAEDPAGTRVKPTSTGFEIITSSNDYNKSGDTFVYMAIRRGPLAQPTSATDVFNITTFGQAGDSTAPAYRSTFPVDMYFEKNSGSTADWFISSRLTGNKYMKTNTTAAEVADSNLDYDYMNGVYTSTGTNGAYYGWMWKRAPSYFDVVAYTGTGSATTVSHNLGAVPEMMWVKQRNDAEDWAVYHSAVANSKRLMLNSTAAEATEDTWNSTTPTSTVFSVGASHKTNKSSATYTAYLFATVAGVSKVGSYTGTGSAQNIECGFSSGAKFVLIKKANDSGHWQVYDTSRGLVSGNDPRLALNLSSAELGGYDFIDPYSGGFAVTTMNDTNENGYTYIFYAIAT